MKLECQQSSASSVQQELEAALAQLEAEQATQQKRLEEVNSKKLMDLTHQNHDLKADIEKLNVCVKFVPLENNLYGFLVVTNQELPGESQEARRDH